MAALTPTEIEALVAEARAYADAASPVWLEVLLRRLADALEAAGKDAERFRRDAVLRKAKRKRNKLRRRSARASTQEK